LSVADLPPAVARAFALATARGNVKAMSSTEPHAGATAPLGEPASPAAAVRRFRLVLLEGDRAGTAWTSSAARCSIGSHPSNDLVLDDPTVSRFHCELRVDDTGVRIRDLESRNGSVVDGVRLIEAYLRHGNVLKLGRSSLELQLTSEHNPVVLSERAAFGLLVGASPAMRAVFALLERAAASSSTVLLDGESGTGKEGAAEAIHAAGARRDGPFVVVDCAAALPSLVESELFGHEKGAFTGASARRLGAFEEAVGGTVFLDEIGELPLDIQAKLLRVLERKEVKRLGSNQMRQVDVRVIAATNRDLRADVNAGRFRPDLFFRLSVVRITLPPLRGRVEDIPLLVDKLLAQLGAEPAAAAALRAPESLARLALAAWPGNVRELRNHLERCLVMKDHAPPGAAEAAPRESWRYAERRRQAQAQFEQQYLQALLARHQGKVALAADEAGVDRAYLYRLMRRRGMTSR
jgi:DNA-binding NtrC family response regulator